MLESKKLGKLGICQVEKKENRKGKKSKIQKD
jgi:hypothetical protein